MKAIYSQKSLTPPIARAAGMARNLIHSIRGASHRLPLHQKRFEALGNLIECLPLDQDEYCYFINRINSTSQLLSAGEKGAAIYQLREMHRKLARLIEDRT